MDIDFSVLAVDCGTIFSIGFAYSVRLLLAVNLPIVCDSVSVWVFTQIAEPGTVLTDYYTAIANES